MAKGNCRAGRKYGARSVEPAKLQPRLSVKLAEQTLFPAQNQYFLVADEYRFNWEIVDSLCAKLVMKLQSIIANVLTEMRALIWIVWRDFKI